MSQTPEDLKFLDSHEWVRLEKDEHLSVGITDYAQESLGDIVYIELPEPGTAFIAGDEVGIIESVKAAAEFYAPISGTIEAINEALAEAPEIINSDCYGNGWLFRIQPDNINELDSLMDANSYRDFCDREAET